MRGYAMKEVERFVTVTHAGQSKPYVYASDYDALLAERDELLAALENLENDNGAIPDHAWQMVKAAIAKCRGYV
jgi:hypothetical protein